MNINGKTKLMGIIGHPLTYTISPQIHNAAYKAVGLNAVYIPMVVDPAALPQAVEGLKALGFLGVNVTMPHKEAVAPCLDRLDGQAEAMSAVNTISFADGAKVGHNTDGRGFLAALLETGYDPSGSRSVVVGAGGASRAVAIALIDAGVEVFVANRSKERAETLVQAVRNSRPDSRVHALEFDEEFADRVRDAELIVNATPVGMAEHPGTPVPGDLLGPGQLVFDLIYQPAETLLMCEAKQRGAGVLGGLSMLVHQAAAAFEIWTGLTAPLSAMEEAAARALER